MSLIPVFLNRSFDDIFDPWVRDPWFRDPWGQQNRSQSGRRRQEPKADRWTYSVKIGDFDPENVNVKVEDGKILVHAKYTDGNNEWGDTVERKRAVKVPEGVDVEKVHSFMRPDGTLILEAPYLSSKDKQLEVVSHEGGALAPLDNHSNLMEFSVGKFKPEEVKISCKDGILTAQGEHKRSEDGCEIRESFFRQLTVPKSVDESKIQCFRDSDGNLTIRAPNATEMEVEIKK